MTSTIEPEQSRVDALIRLMGLVILGFGVLMLYSTYYDGAVSGVASEIITINYALGLLLVIVGLFAVLAKFK
jgi:uncharacterized protein YjeT (DUF2065 family)